MSGEGARGGHNFLSLFYVSTNFKRIFFEKNRRTLFGSLKCRQTLFNAQILFYKDFYDFFRFTRPSPIVNGFPSFAMDLRVANWRPTYLFRAEKNYFYFRSTKTFTFVFDLHSPWCSHVLTHSTWFWNQVRQKDALFGF